MQMVIRLGQEKDMDSLLEIYNHEVLYSTATFDLNPKTMEERMVWFLEHTGHHPLLVGLENDNIAGYATLSPYRAKEAYASTVELSVYVHHEHRGRGIGKGLMEAILKRAREDDAIHTVISVITGGNAASIRLHEELGFTHCGTMREVGRKFDQLLDIDNFQLLFTENLSAAIF